MPTRALPLLVAIALSWALPGAAAALTGRLTRIPPIPLPTPHRAGAQVQPVTHQRHRATSGELPRTGEELSELVLIGSVLMLVGVGGARVARR